MNLMKRLPPWALLLLIAIYILSPVDLLPDFFGLPSRVDDLFVALAGLLYLYIGSQAKARRARTSGQRSQRAGDRKRGEDTSGREEGGKEETRPRDPYEILGVKRGTPLPEIKRLYKEKLLQYHPDRVQHMGSELQELAEQRTKEITEAYQKVLKERGET